MRSSPLAALLLASCIALSGAVARADEPPPFPAPAPYPLAAAPAAAPVAFDDTLAALRGQVVIIRLRSGGLVEARLLTFDATALWVRQRGQDGVIPRAAVAGIAPLRPPEASDPADNPEATRHVAMQVALALPGLGLDVSVGHFYGFLNVSALFPYLTGGEGFGGALGLGATWRMGPSSRWHFDLFANVGVLGGGGGSLIDIGAGIGFHYTSPGGFTIAFKLPVSGFSPQTGGLAGLYIHYYVAGQTVPLVSLGYRF